MRVLAFSKNRACKDIHKFSFSAIGYVGVDVDCLRAVAIEGCPTVADTKARHAG